MAGKILTIAQQKGGTGKTTVSAHIAVALSRMPGMSVAMLDVDPQGSLGEWYEARETALGEQGTGLEFRTASGWGARREAQRMARDHDFVIVDTPPHADLDARPAIDAADLVIIPVQPTPVDLWATRTTLEMLGGSPEGLIVLNRVPPRGRLTAEMMAAMTGFGGRIAEAQIGNRIAFAESLGKGLTVLERGGASRAADEIEALAAELLARLA
ncbi:MAG: ParA family partition ATPase [Rhodospirillaceae bacterium]